jgi:glucose/mannose-6-phosphate isomerase
VFLEDPEAEQRVVRRIEVTAELAGRGAAVVERVRARGETRLERLVSLVLLGDLVSLYIAVLRGVDPVSVRVIDLLKERLSSAD